MAVTNIIDAIQQKYAALTSFSGKPSELVFGDVWPTNASGQFTGYPFIRFLHQETPFDTTFASQVGEKWGFEFEIYGQSVQVVKPIFDGVMFNQLDPSDRAGFWKASSVTLPTGYVFKHFIMTGGFRIDVRSGQFSPTGTAIYVLSWPMQLWAQRSES